MVRECQIIGAEFRILKGGVRFVSNTIESQFFHFVLDEEWSQFEDLYLHFNNKNEEATSYIVDVNTTTLMSDSVSILAGRYDVFLRGENTETATVDGVESTTITKRNITIPFLMESIVVGTEDGVYPFFNPSLQEQMVSLLSIITTNGIGTRYLADDGTYKVVSGGGGSSSSDYNISGMTSTALNGTTSNFVGIICSNLEVGTRFYGECYFSDLPNELESGYITGQVLSAGDTDIVIMNLVSLDVEPYFWVYVTSEESMVQDTWETVQVNDYNVLENKPRINNVVLEGNKTTEQIGIEVDTGITNIELEGMLI